jgi:hypothetical protein
LQGRNQVGDEGAKAIAAALQQNSSVHALGIVRLILWMFFSAEFAFAFQLPCVRADMSFAGRQPSRRRGSEGHCCGSATEQQLADAVLCKMNVVDVFLF